MKLARTDYKPIDLNNPTDPFANRLGRSRRISHCIDNLPREGVVTDIQDFFAGVSYQIDRFFGNCNKGGTLALFSLRSPVINIITIYTERPVTISYLLL